MVPGRDPQSILLRLYRSLFYFSYISIWIFALQHFSITLFANTSSTLHRLNLFLYIFFSFLLIFFIIRPYIVIDMKYSNGVIVCGYLD